MSGDAPLAAGDLGPWVADLQAALGGERDADVPCNGCTACCTSSQFVHIGPDETDTLAHVPSALRFPAPGMPPGHVVLGYDEHGHCPMLVDGACSIYEHRPRTCRTYDCRVFTATGIEPDSVRPRIAERARRWRFTVATERDRAARDALDAAVAFLDAHPDVVPAEAAAATQRAALAVRISTLFLAGQPEVETVATALAQPLAPDESGRAG